jgi:hypothetical protein
MNSRVVFASFLAVLAVGAMLPPTEAEARAGGMGMGRAGAFRGGAMPFSMRPHGHIRPAPRLVGHVGPGPRPFVHPRFAPRPHFVGPRHGFIGPRHHHHRRNGYDSATVAGVTVYSGYSGSSGWPSYSSNDAQAPAYQPYVAPQSYVVPTEYTSPLQSAGAVGGPAVGLRHICRSDVETVPSERGGKAEVRVTRCYHE